MHKRQFEREQQRKIEESKIKRRNTRNFIIGIISLGLAVFCYYFLDGVIGNG